MSRLKCVLVFSYYSINKYYQFTGKKTKLCIAICVFVFSDYSFNQFNMFEGTGSAETFPAIIFCHKLQFHGFILFFKINSLHV